MEESQVVKLMTVVMTLFLLSAVSEQASEEAQGVDCIRGCDDRCGPYGSRYVNCCIRICQKHERTEDCKFSICGNFGDVSEDAKDGGCARKCMLKCAALRRAAPFCVSLCLKDSEKPPLEGIYEEHGSIRNCENSKCDDSGFVKKESCGDSCS
ncbi:uncharacterized protein LOC105634962 isoform X2 [Jatropha curcas]|uniref:uncharacterized protein LOC105634962 isoform X2 n=1 Tax=Jatropha curcas TaxID=180498 RepID=UPI0005FB4184|nr:uncharacterized protein LOC105634962 isoform X2 [Jatropha curcas]